MMSVVIDGTGPEAVVAREQAMRLLAAVHGADGKLAGDELVRVLAEVTTSPDTPLAYIHLIRAFAAIGAGCIVMVTDALETTYGDVMRGLDAGFAAERALHERNR